MDRTYRLPSALRDLCRVAVISIITASFGATAVGFGFNFEHASQTPRIRTRAGSHAPGASAPFVPASPRVVFAGYGVTRELQARPAAPSRSRERIAGEAGGRAHVGTVSSTRGVDHSDLRIHLLEATTLRLWRRSDSARDRAPEAHVNVAATNN